MNAIIHFRMWSGHGAVCYPRSGTGLSPFSRLDTMESNSFSALAWDWVRLNQPQGPRSDQVFEKSMDSCRPDSSHLTVSTKGGMIELHFFTTLDEGLVMRYEPFDDDRVNPDGPNHIDNDDGSRSHYDQYGIMTRITHNQSLHGKPQPDQFGASVTTPVRPTTVKITTASRTRHFRGRVVQGPPLPE